MITKKVMYLFITSLLVCENAILSKSLHTIFFEVKIGMLFFKILIYFNEIKLFFHIFIGYFVGLRSLEDVLVQYDFGKIRNHFVF